ncbi:type II toxin-antitoxin system HicA family toxin [Actinomycetospora sp. NBRC 106375]|uniref:type II toxin-antitoxin system HicA family toxin n=1 Tax=Actinomycetospora sp. NBRC 106375 TaxID=3032207 RepID=UPI00255692E0|nr:type II toxin-antitoxin system HicA family toxin [Actinomycetospora sp. NBRC 106375]
MRRRDVARELRRHGCTVLRDKGGHEVWGCPCGQHRAPVPHHTMISPGVVRSIRNTMGCLPEGWLQ